MSFTVGQLAKLTGLTVRALHHYDAIGLLTPSQRSPSGYRLYTSQDVSKLFRIQALQSVGLSLAEIEKALARRSSEPADLIAQQLSAVDIQIEHATTLRARLMQLQEVLQRGDEPAAGDWVVAVELITQYGQYCSAEELQRLVAHSKEGVDEWRQFVVELQNAVDTKVPANASAARSLLKQWTTLLLQKVGGDLNLALKMKLAYARDANLQTRLAVERGLTHDMMAYLAEVMLHTHRALWARHLDPPELQRLRWDGDWQRNLLPTVGSLLSGMSAMTEAAGEAARKSWHALLADFTGDDSALAEKVASILCGKSADQELARMWLISDDLQAWLWQIESDVAIVRESRRPHDRLQ